MMKGWMMETKIWPAHHIGTVVAARHSRIAEEIAPPNPHRRTGYSKLETVNLVEKCELDILPHGSFYWFDDDYEVKVIRWRKSDWLVEAWGWLKFEVCAGPLTFEMVKLP